MDRFFFEEAPFCQLATFRKEALTKACFILMLHEQQAGVSYDVPFRSSLSAVAQYVRSCFLDKARLACQERETMDDVREIDEGGIKETANLFQSSFWVHFKQRRGHATQLFHVHYQGRDTYVAMVHRQCATDACFAYVPYGPDITLPEDEQGPFLEFVSERIRPLLPTGCRFVRYDLPWENPYAREAAHETDWSGPPAAWVRELRMNFGSRHWNLRKAPTDMQPPDTVVIDLRHSDTDILQGMHQKTRYCIRKSLSRGVQVVHGGLEALSAWYGLYQDMAVRKGIVEESLDYFHALFTTARSHKTELRLYLAFKRGVLLAGSIFAFQPDTAYYLYSASSLYGRKHMAAYPILWQAMKDARQAGCRWFDLFGIPPTRERSHPMYGLYRFKTRFGGWIRHFRGCWDYPLDHARYQALAHVPGLMNPYYVS